MKWIYRRRATFANLIMVLILSFLSLAVRGVAAQDADASAACAGLKFEIRVPDDIIRPQASMLLELRLTNVTQREMFLPSRSTDFWSYEFELRDAQGKLARRTSEWTRAISERPNEVTLDAGLSLAAGASLTQTVILDRLFDLRKQGRYTGRVSINSLACENSGTHLTSNLISFKISPPSDHISETKSGISVVASAPTAHLPVGWAVPLDIVVQNKSSHPLRWAVDNPANTAPDEFLTGAEVFEGSGKRQSPPKLADLNWNSTRFRSTVSILEIAPGKSAEQMVLLGDLFDVSQPGKYGTKVSLVDPISNRLVNSNMVPVEIEDPSSTGPHPKQPPFIVTLRAASLSPSDSRNVLVCMSNISDRDIRLDNFALKDLPSVETSDGIPAIMKEAAIKDWEPEHLKQGPSGFQGCCTSTVKPRKALCGGMGVGVVYDLSRPGPYRVRVDRYDETDAMPGQKLGELPLVHSNWLTIIGPSLASSEHR